MKLSKKQRVQGVMLFKAFLTETQGVYAIMMVLLSFFLIGFIALVVDGSGILHDRTRFTQGLEQAGLFITAENNKNRKPAVHSNPEKRDYEVMKTITRSYYLPASYTKLSDSQIPTDFKLKPNQLHCADSLQDAYAFNCQEIGKTGKTTCTVSGAFCRPSWLYLGSDAQKWALSFDRTTKIAKSLNFGKRKGNKEEENDIPTIDMIFVIDLSSSMGRSLTDGNVDDDNPAKLTLVKNTLKKLTDMMLANKDNKQHRIGLIGFSTAAQLPFSDKYIFPYKYYNEREARRDYYRAIDSENVDIEETFEMIENFNGSFLDDGPFKDSVTLSENRVPRFKIPYHKEFWYQMNPKDIKQLQKDVASVEEQGETLSSSGLILAANAMFIQPRTEKNKKLKRIITILSDGSDNNSEITPWLLNPEGHNKYIENNLCGVIKKKLKESTKEKPEINFIAFNYDKNDQRAIKQKEDWLKCVGDKHYFTADNADQLLKAFIKTTGGAVGFTDEVGFME